MPEILDVYNFEEAETLRAQYLGVPGKVMRTDKELLAIRKQRSDAQAQAKQEEQQKEITQAVGGNDASAQVMGAVMA
jgi:ppGpp synthetase/RelA/SpoT-type nucleotidyltranferase